MAMSSQVLSVSRHAAVALATLAVASCVPSHSLQQVEASNPSVTYEYSGDQELLQAQQNAVAFCNQYQSAPRPARFTSGANNSGNHVIFECDPNLPAAVSPQQASAANLTYSYRTDQELLEASRSAQTHCIVSGSQVAVSNISTNTDGSRTVTFQCTPG